jgi:hypothetical protein
MDNDSELVIYTVSVFILFWWAFYYIATGKVLPDIFFENK